MTNVPDEALAALCAVETVLGHPPIAAYLSGSAVDGGLRPFSDVDVLVVVEDAPSGDARQRLAAARCSVRRLVICWTPSIRPTYGARSVTRYRSCSRTYGATSATCYGRGSLTSLPARRSP